ncbi:MAG: FmdE family protein [Chitinispirillaceae bacterium]|nr:FmdE family protein [Chitinispirillaceae bacterium]
MEDFPIDYLKPRRKIQEMLRDGNIKGILELAGMLHGHYCVGLALGVKAVFVVFSKLNILEENNGMEEIMAVVECNNCFLDGIQIASGCTIGNNALVYKDLGKTAATFYRRNSDEAIRICVKSFEFKIGTEEEERVGNALFEKAVKRREKLTNEEQLALKKFSTKRSFSVVNMPEDELFTIKRVKAPLIPYAPILNSQICSICGEKVMESKAIIRENKIICKECGNEEYYMINGKGISSGIF